jgi:hypothetical protein
MIVSKDFEKSINFLQKVYVEGYDVLIFNKSLIKIFKRNFGYKNIPSVEIAIK